MVKLTTEEERFRKKANYELYSRLGHGWISAKDEKRLKQLEAKRMKTSVVKKKTTVKKKVAKRKTPMKRKR